jgi:hypothetical protein
MERKKEKPAMAGSAEALERAILPAVTPGNRIDKLAQ